MKKSVFIFICFSVINFGLLGLSFAQVSGGNISDNYEILWEKANEFLVKSLPESADKTLDEIEQKALKENNQTQLLKSWLNRQKVFLFTVEDDPQQAYIRYIETKTGRLDAVHNALLHEEIAYAYAEYLDQNEWRINSNLPVEGGDLSGVEMKYWDKPAFEEHINRYFEAALQPADALKKAETKDFLLLFDNLPEETVPYLDYEKTLFEFLFHRIASYYRSEADRNDVEGGMESDEWWLPARSFVNVDLSGDAYNPLVKCLKIFQELIACHLESGNEDALIYNDYKRYEFVNSILDQHVRYQEALEQMKAQHADNPLSAGIAALMAQNLMLQYDKNSSDSAFSDNYRKALAICKQAISAFPDSKGAENCRNLVRRIEEPQIGLSMNDVQLPGEAIPAVLEYRNAFRPYYRIIKVSEKDLSEWENMTKIGLLDELGNRMAVVEQELSLPAETDCRFHRTLVALPALERGIYYWVGSIGKDNKDKAKMMAVRFQVSRLGYVADKREADRMTVFVIDRKTGKSVEGATVEVFQRSWNHMSRKYRTQTLATMKSGPDGEVLLDKKFIGKGIGINLRKGDDNLLSEKQYYLYSDENDKNYHYKTCFFTDRAIYRPGQTVYFQGIVTGGKGDELGIVDNFPETVSFRDANWQEIASAKFTTDEYGSFSGSFVIPADRLSGTFHLSAKHGGTTFRVEEYKRPTFEVNFEKPKETYKLNDNVTINGDVKAYAGFGLDDVEYSYRVVRKTTFPWRCCWWFYPAVEDEQIACGRGRTDENGKFAVTFHLKPSQTIVPEKQPLFTYEIEVTATGRQGETHSKKYSIRAGYNKIAISTDIPSEIGQSAIGKFRISVGNLSGEPAKSRILRKIYLYEETGRPYYFETMSFEAMPDRQLLSEEELERLFPAYRMYGNSQRNLVHEEVVDVDDTAVFYTGKPLKSGKYVVELSSMDDPLAKYAQTFTIFEEESKKMPVTAMAWSHSDRQSARPGEEIGFTVGSSAKGVEIRVQLLHGNEIRLDKKIVVGNSVQRFTYTVDEKDRGGLAWRYVFVKENSFNSGLLNVSVPFDNYNLDVRLATVRAPLAPGAEENWEVTVRDYRDKPLETALLACMYDASLDEFASNRWWFDMSPYRTNGYSAYSFLGDGYGFSSSRSNQEYFQYIVLFNFSLPSDAPFFDFGIRLLQSRGNRANRANSLLLYEKSAKAAAKGYFAESDKAVIQADAAISTEYEVGYFEETAAGDLNPDEEEESSQPAEPMLRENFSETAFFYPQLRTNADGSATFSFTMPDALTRWKLMLLAYTKERQTGYKEYTFTSSKPVMIMADMPRYLYDNDTIWMVANVINTGEEAVTPKAKLEIFDAATMQPLNLLLSDAEIPMETILPGRSHEVRWKVAARHDLGLIAFRFTAYAGTFSDAEQRLLPVLCSEVFMTQTLPFTVKANSEQTFNFDAIANPSSNERDHSLTLNFSSNPVWYAVQSLPYLANTKTDNAENAFYVFYANTLSSYIASKIPNLLNYIKKWQIETPEALHSQLERDQELKAIMLKETPWVLEAKSESEQRSRLAALFEVNRLRNRQSNALKLISDKQQYNGGWSWRDGMPESPFISTFILSGFGRLQQMGALESLDQDERRRVSSICDRAVRYLEQQVAEDYRNMKKNSDGKDWPVGSLTLNELYALSFFKEQNSDKGFATAKKYWLGSLDKEWTSFNFNQRAKAALVLNRSGNIKTAELIVQSFKECAQKNDLVGMYWPKKYFSFESHIATHANIMAAFAEISPDNEMMDQLRVWLLTQKQTNRWENSASTADALYALLMRGSDWFAEGKEVTLSFGNTPIGTEGGEAGTGFIQRCWNASEVTLEMRRLTVNNPTGHLVWGGLFRQYFVPIDEVKGDESGFTIKRELFVEIVTDNGEKLVPVEKQALKVGDKVTVKITFESKQDMSHVFVKDLRAAGFEPLEQVSRYRSNDRMWYYQTNTDTDMEFFIEHLPKGTHQLEYSMFVTKEGVLNNGYSLIQCQYAPEFTAYSNGMKVKVGE